jgi:hypothetical protein
MRSKILFTAIPFLFALVACAPVPTSAPTNTPAPTATLTPVHPTSMPQSTAISTQSNIPTKTSYVNENASDDCFVNVEFIPEKTGMNEVISAWGNPSEKSSFGEEYEYWYFDFAGVPYISFNKQIIDTIRFSLKNCSLEKIIAKLGPPEKIEITVAVSCVGGPTMYSQDFHYPSLGFSYYRSCDEAKDCFTFHPSDDVNGKEFYPSGKVIQDSTGFNMAGYVYNWHGFDVDVETIENKIKDFVKSTPTP